MSKKRHTAADEPHFLIRTLAADLPDGYAIQVHSHGWHQLLYAVRGVMSIWTSEGSWVAPPQWAVWAPAGVAHAMRFAGASSVRTLYVRPDRWAGLSEKSAALAVSTLLRELIVRAVELGMLDEREAAHVALAELIVHELTAAPAPVLDLPLPATDTLRRVAEHIVAAPGESLRQAALAERFGLGARTLERGFLAETGMSFGRWRREARLMQALRRLGSGASVKEVAREAGYRSPSAFIAAFRARLGTTPTRYFETAAP